MFRFLRCRVLLPPTICSTNGSHSATTSHAFFLRNPLSTTVLGGKEESLTVSYLKDTCGLSSEAAIRASKRLHLKATENADYVLKTLKDYGFSKTQIAKIIVKLPVILSRDPDKIIIPKFEYLRSSGFTGPEVADLLLANPGILASSLERKIMPGVSLLKRILPSKEHVSNVLKKTNQLLTLEHATNIDILRNYGVSEAVIMKFLSNHPRSLMRSPERFELIVKKVKDMRLNPDRNLFAHGVGIMSYMSDSTWEKKVALYKSLGWSDNDLSLAFQKQPSFIGYSEEGIRQKINFFMTNLGYDRTFLSARPKLLMMSLEKKLIPRWSILNILLSRRLITMTRKPVGLFMISDKKFFDEYVAKYKDEIPELVKAYQDNMATLEHGKNCAMLNSNNSIFLSGLVGASQ